MKTNRRNFLTGALIGGTGVVLPAAAARRAAPPAVSTPDYATLDAVLKEPVLKRQLFSTPVIIDTLELLRLDNSFLCRVRSKDGAEGISVANNSQQRSLYPIHVNRLQPFFLGKDARDLESLLEEVYVYQSNYKLQSLALWVPLATIEFAILDMLGRIANKSIGQLVGDIHNPKVRVYRANGERDVTADAVMENLKRQVAESEAKALKIKIGGRMSHIEYPPGRSEKLIPMVRKEFGDQDPVVANTLRLLGAFSMQDEKYHEAILAFRECLLIRTESKADSVDRADAAYHLGEAFLKAGKTAEGRRYLQSARALLTSDDVHARRLRSTIEKSLAGLEE